MECERLDLDVLGLSELRWIGNGCETANGFSIYYSGGATRHHGVGFMLPPRSARCVLQAVPVNDRVFTIRLDAKPKPITYIQVYMPTSDSDDEEVFEVYREVQKIIDSAKKDRIIIMGDFNAKTGVTTLAVNAGTARQSTTAYGSGGAPGRALDSNTGGHWTKNTCTHTLHYNEKGNKQIPWWSVELTQKAEVQAVEIQNREDCCSHRLANFRIMVDNQQCRHFPGTFSGRKTLPCSRPVIGKKITIRLSTNREPLTLCDVTIKGRRLTGGACGGNSGACSPKGGNRHLAVNVNTARQATLAYGNGGAPGRAVDGDDGGHWSKNTCTHTLHYNEQGNKQIPWWSVELMQPGLVKGLEIQNRIDCCAHRLTNFSIRVDGKLCKFHAGSFNGRKTIYCDRPVCGKKIEIKLATNREPLTLCDVRVIGA